MHVSYAACAAADAYSWEREGLFSRLRSCEDPALAPPQVLADVSLDYELTLGNCLESIRWDSEGKAVVICATNGYLWTYDVSSK